MNWLDNASIGTMTVALLVAFFALGWILLKLCDVVVAIGAAFARWRAECEEREDFAERDTVPPGMWIPAPPPEPAPPPYSGPPRRLTMRKNGSPIELCNRVCPGGLDGQHDASCKLGRRAD